MTTVIQVFGGLMVLAGASMVIKPTWLVELLGRYKGRAWLHGAAVGVRLILGALLITQASLSGYPRLVSALGWLMLLAGLVLAAMGRERFVQLMSWVLQRFSPFARPLGVVAIGFGSLLVLAF